MLSAALPIVVATVVAAATPGRTAAPVEPAAERALAVAALEDARVDAALRVELLELVLRARGCGARSVEADAPVEVSGVVPLHLEGIDADGEPCRASATARVRVFAPALRLKGALARGAKLDADDVEHGEVELKAGSSGAPLPWRALPSQARAARPLARGAWLRPSDLEHGPRVGEAVLVSVQSGALRLEESGRVAPCPGGSRGEGEPGRACASLKGGRRVAGVLDPERGVLVVEVRR